MPVKSKVKGIGKHSARAARAVGRGSKSVARASVPHAKKLAKKTHHATKKVAHKTVHHTKKVSKVAHKHIAQRPHAYLLAKVPWYKSWHNWKFSKHTHIAIFAVYSLFISFLLFSSYRATFAAPDLQNTWDFSNPADYTLDDGVEIQNGVARLKAQNYTSDSNTSALYHFDESSGSTATDSSSNSNDATSTNPPTFGAGNLNNAATFDGLNDLFTVNDSASLSPNFANTIEGWTKFDTAFGNNTHDNKQTIVDKGSYKLEYDNTTGKINYEMADAGATTWSQVGGDKIGESWGEGFTAVCDQASDGTIIYVALCGTTQGEVWRWNGTNWAKIGGQGLDGSWDSTIGSITALKYAGGKLYAGTGDNDNLSQLWEWDGNDWTKLGGNALGGSWPGTVELVSSLDYMNGDLYVGTGRGANDAKVYKWDGSTWTWVGGFGVTGYTAFPTGYETVYSLSNDGTNLYAALGLTAGDADVWRLNGTTWTQVGGDGLNSSWAASTYETVYSMYYQGSTLYAGLGNSGGDGELWAYTGGTWSKLGGDTFNGSWAATIDSIRSITGDGTSIYVGLGDNDTEDNIWRLTAGVWTQIGGGGINGGYANVTNNNSQVSSMIHVGGILYAGFRGSSGDLWTWNGSTWAQIGGDGFNKSWGHHNFQTIESMTPHNGKLYAGGGYSISGNATVWEYDGSSWNMVGGQALNGSWAVDAYEGVQSMASHKGELYVGLGRGTSDSEVWKYNGSTWTQIGGDGLNSGWPTGYETLQTLVSFNGELYAGLGENTNEAEVWKYNGSIWAKVGGDGVNNSWSVNIDTVFTMVEYNGELYAGLGANVTDSEVWKYNGSTWTHVGGSGVNSSWSDGANIDVVEELVVYNGELYASTGYNNSADAQIWKFDGSTWSQVGGGGMNGSWTVAERVFGFTVYNGELYAGLGHNNGYAEVWKYNGSTWTLIGGDGINTSWSTEKERVASMTVYNGTLYAGTGDSGGDPQVWAYGDNAFLSSDTALQDTNWHHIAASYDGDDMKIYIDGVEDASRAVSNLMPDNNKKLLIGSGYGTNASGTGAGHFKGKLDEIRISKAARTSFTTQPYRATRQLVTLDDAVFESGIQQWDTFGATESANGGTITYRLSADNGETWLYYDGSDWVESSSESQASTAAQVNDGMNDFPVTFFGFQWQAILFGNGSQQVGLSGVELEATSDSNPPSANASNITAQKAQGGSAFVQNAWTNGASPFFAWDAAVDDDAGIKGYCLYLGQDNTADPASTNGLLGTSPTHTGNACQFLVEDNEVDFGTADYIETALSTSASPYYLRIRAIDRAGNLSATTASFAFNFDSQSPTNPAFISAPSGFVTEKEFTMTWPITGGNAPSDARSGLAGLQYKINDGSWYGDDHTGTGDIADLLINDGTYTTVDPEDFDELIDGVNTIYFRTWDNAGNVTTSYTTATVRINTTGAPSEPQNVDVTPNTNTTNAFAFDWDSPADFAGEEENLVYCYTINTLPSGSTCTYTSEGVTSLGAGPYANQPGTNTFYVVARDEIGSINYSSYTSVTFTANTPSPGIPTNIDVVDVSVKATSNWRLALTWDVPTNVGAGIANYRIYRSDDNDTFTQIGTSSGTTYIDNGLSQQRYYYRVRACDNTTNCGANSTVVDDTPTGRFTEAATETSPPVVTDVTTKKATISWSTSRESDSRIALGTSSGEYSSSEITVSEQVTSHVVEMDNLRAGTTYYFVAKWTDEDGNTGQSQEYVFETSPAPSLKEIKTTRIGMSSALVQFTSRNAVRAAIFYGQTEAFGGVKKLNTASSESTYNVELDGLEDGTKYFYKVVTYDAEGTSYDGSIFSFTTPARPRISNLRFQPIKGEPTSTQKVTWDTNVPASSRVTYGKINTNGRDILKSKMTTSHEIVIRDLEDSSEYFLIAESRDANGIIAVSDRQTFETALDTRPPEIRDVQIESSIRGTGADARGQIIVSWKTDELTTSQVAFTEGSNPTVFNNRTTEDSELSTEHVVIVSDLPTSRVFSVRPISSDEANNSTEGPIESTIIGRPTEGVLSIVLSTLQRIFGF